MASTYAQLVESLKHPAAYPHPAAAVRHLHTHISDVFLAGPYAYKLKKPVDFGFLDFTTLEKRRQACEDEVRLNRRLAPDTYLGVMPVCAVGADFQVRSECASGDAVDYVVRMVRLPQSGLLDRLAEQGKLTREHLRQAARAIGNFHARADRGPAIDVYGKMQNTAARIDQNFAQTQKYIGISISPEQYSALATAFARFLRDNESLFERRLAQGRIVDGHGDLHLRNMCSYGGKIIIFDCIEFSAAFRCGDVINDIAFLTMDLDARGLAALSTYFLNAYLEQTQDYGGLALLDFYQAYRAYVRGKVNSFLLDDARDPGRRAAITREAAHYFDLAHAYFAPRAPGVLLTSGLSGSGKSTVARRAAELIGGIIVRSDAVRKYLSGIGVHSHAPARFGEGIYSTDMTARTYAAMAVHAEAIVDAGRWVILDATYSRREQRKAVLEWARSRHLPVGIVHCNAALPELERRLHRREARASDISDAGVDVLHQQLPGFEPPGEDEAALLQWDGRQDLEAWVKRIANVSVTPRAPRPV
jgi:aminoglycoside phosphotransferase family enzyme/predicted kinase